MNILFVDQYSDLGGAQRCLIDLLPAVRERGWTATVAAPGNGPLFDHCRAVGVAVEQIRCGPYSSGPKTLADMARFAGDFVRLQRHVAELVERRRIDLVYVNGPRLVPAIAWTIKRRLPFLFHCHSHVTGMGAVLLGRALRPAATVIASCQSTAAPLTRHVPSDRMHVVYNGVEDCARERRATIDGTWRIGVLGRIAPEKGQAGFVEAVRILTRDLPRARFLICGEALFADPAALNYVERVRRAADGVPVEFLGWRDDVPEVLAGLDLLIVPSLKAEATTRVILEAGSAGVPVVASRLGGIPEVVVDGETGLLVDSPIPAALAAAIRSLTENPERLRRMGEAGRKLWQGRFTVTQYQDQVLAIVEKLCRNRAGASGTAIPR